MKFLTKRDSETGKKMLAFYEKMQAQMQAQKAFAKEIGFEKWTQWSHNGRIAYVIFPEGHEVDTKLWKPAKGRKGAWSVKLTSKAGKELEKRFDALPAVHGTELNKCVGYEEYGWESIGADFGHDEVVGFSIWDDHKGKFTMPDDCWEITSSEYEKYFPKSQEY